MQRHGALLAAALVASGSLPLLSIGCDNSADSLTDSTNQQHPGGSTTSGSSSGSAGTSADGGSTDPTAGENPAAAATAEALFTALAPTLTSNCGPCHTTGSAGAPVWLGVAPNQYATIKAYKGIVTADPSTSLLVTKPQHEGPALSAALIPQVEAWITAEAAAVATAPTTTITTAPIAIPTGAGSITLPAPGGTLTFTASMNGDILSMKTLALVAPAATGIHATGIHIFLVHTDGTQTDDESLAGSDTSAAAGATAVVGAGLVVIPSVQATDKIQLTIDSLVAATVTAAPTGGCKDVTSFQTNVAPQFLSLCINCHNTGGSGFGSLDMSALKLATPDYTKACGQALAKVDTTNVAQSPLLTTPTGGDAGHPLKTAPASYTTAVTTWINAEK